jgi:hypothetical protein
LQKLTADDLKEYASDALYTWGGEHDFKHFLPRLLELLVIAKDPGLELVDPEALFRKLPYASWRSWPEPEREAISRFMREMWQAALHTEPEDLAWDGVGQWLCALANCEDDMTPYLQTWLAQSCSTAYRNLAKVILELGIPYRTDVPMGYWEGRRGQWHQLIEWIKSSAVLQEIEAAVERWPDKSFSEELFEAAVFLKP